MKAPIRHRLHAFTESLLSRRGALVEWPLEAEEGLALLPHEAARALGSGEALPLGYGPQAGTLAVNLATDFLTRISPLVEREPGIGTFRGPDLYIKSSDMAGPVERTFTWLNARVRVALSQPERILYHTWYFRAEMQSADRWEDVLKVTFNTVTGAAVEVPDPLEHLALMPTTSDATDLQVEGFLAAKKASHGLSQRSREFVARLDRQFERDRRRLVEYYQALLTDEQRKGLRDRDDAAHDKRDAKVRAVELEQRRKLAELEERYAMEAILSPLAVARVELPVLAVYLDVARRQETRRHVVYWNALRKELEPMCCGMCRAEVFAVAFTDREVQPRCSVCIAQR